MPRSRWTERLRHLGLAALYFAVVTPAGLCARVVRDPLRRSRDGHRTSYLERPAPSSGTGLAASRRPGARTAKRPRAR